MSVTLHQLTIRYGAVTAVADATATFPSGAVGLLGRNGAGKTSILKALLGLVRPASGQLQILDVAPGASGQEIRRRVGYMAERESLVSGLNAYETVRLAAQLSGLPSLDAARRAHEVLYLVGLGEARYRPVAGYSTGMRQKVKLAVALVHDPEILFLDEPTNGLDPGGRTEMLGLVKMLTAGLGKSVVLSSHILQDVEAVCDHVVLMERGRVLTSGPVADLTRASVRVFHCAATSPEAALCAELAARGATVARGEGFSYRIELPGDVGPAVLFAAVQATGGVVHRLVEHRRTLEEVFLGAVQAAAEGDR